MFRSRAPLKPLTSAALESKPWIWPLPIITGLRYPHVSDGFASVRAGTGDGLHGGADLMYERLPSEPAHLPRGTKLFYMPEGIKARAAGDGIVGVAHFVPTGGHVRIDHGDGLSTVYHHLASVDVVPGQPIHRGTPIGLVGGSPPIPGRAVYGLVHLHFEIWGASIPDGYTKIDPEPLLKRWEH